MCVPENFLPLTFNPGGEASFRVIAENGVAVVDDVSAASGLAGRVLLGERLHLHFQDRSGSLRVLLRLHPRGSLPGNRVPGTYVPVRIFLSGGHCGKIRSADKMCN